MADKEILSTIRYVAGTKPVFRLSEITAYLNEPLSVEDLFTRVSASLAGLGLTAQKKGRDYEISRISPPQAYLLNPEESARLDAFFEQRTVPALLQESIEQYLAKKVGKDWTDPVILERLRRAIVAQKDDYWKPQHKRSLQYTKGYSVLGYLAYHFPVYFMQTEYLLALLAQNGLLKKRMTILDAGTGPGVVPLAVADFYSRLDSATADVYSIERSEEHVEAFLSLRESCVPRGGKVSIKPPIRADLRTLDPGTLPAQIDLAVFSNVLNELPDATLDTRAEIVARIAGRLAPGGIILIVEPADEENATRMRSLTVALRDKGLFVTSPCAFIWGTPCTAPRCWSFRAEPAIKMPRLMEILARCEESYRFVNTDIKYSYAILEKEQKKEQYRLSAGSKFLRLSKLQQHVGKRVNAAGLKMSQELGSARNHVYKICDGTAKTPVYAVLPSYHITPENDAVTTAPYGSVLEMKGVLVRYNKEHNAYNLLISRNTLVCRKDADCR
ncbi:MAG: small ribosomal subunit Rsm22 family protein [Methanoregula sp.]